MSFPETNITNPYHLDQAPQIDVEMHHKLAALQASGEPVKPVLDMMEGFSDLVFEKTGVQTLGNEANTLAYKEQLGRYDVPELSRFNLAVGVANEATSLDFSLEGDDDQATKQARTLIADYDAYTELRRSGKPDSELPEDYGKRQLAKLLLVESSARDIARRIGIEDPVLDSSTLAAIKEKTGLGFYEQRGVMRGPVRRQAERIEPAHGSLAEREESRYYAGAIGTPVIVSGLGSTVIAGYNQLGKPVVRGKNGKLESTFGRL